MGTIQIIVIFSITLLFNLSVNGLPTLVDTNTNQKNDQCDSCNALVSFIDKLSQNNSDYSLDKALVRLCNDYSALPGQQTTRTCTFIVNDLFKMFKNVNKTTFCKEISACYDSDFDSKDSVDDNLNDDPTCDFCQNVVNNIKDIVSSQSTELEIKYLVENACHYLGSFENECVSLSDEYLDSLFSFIRESLQPKKFCQSIGACKQAVKQIEKIAEISEIINIFPVNTPLIPLKKAEPVEKESDDIECLICKRIVKYLIQELKDNRTEEAIIEALDRVCSLFPSKDRQQCDSFVQEYTDELIHILIEETDPDLACTLIGVCVPKSVWKPINSPSAQTETLDNVESQKKNKWNTIEESIEVEDSDEANDSVDSKVDTSKKSAYCYECEMIMHFIQNELYNYNTEEQIEEFVENQLCDRLKIVITKEACDNFVRQYGPQVIQVIAQKLFDPSTVCQVELKLCPNNTQTATTSTTSQPPEQDFVMVDRASAKCELCISLVQQMDTLLENDEFDQEVAKIVEKTCKVLPKNRQVECELMIEGFTPYFLQMIGHMNDANQICKSIDMCYTAGQVQLLGGHKCTFGPTYWCHTIAHAEACKATHFCRNKVWKATP